MNVLNVPIVFLEPDLKPTNVFLLAVFERPASEPMNTEADPPQFDKPAKFPTNVFSLPVLLHPPATCPTNVFLVPDVLK